MENLRKRRLWLVLVFGALTAFAPLTIDMYLPAFPMLTEELNTNTSLTQLTLTACLLGIAFGQLVVGPISDVRGRRTPLLIALTIYMISSLLCAIAPSIWTLVVLRFIQGASGAAGIVISRACVRDLYSGSEITKFFALLILVMGAAPILAPMIGGQLLHFVSWRGIFVALAIIGVTMLFAVLFGLPDTLPKDKRSQGGLKNILSIFLRLFRDRVFIGYVLAQGLVMGAMFAYIAGSPFVLQNIFGVSPQGYGLFFAINAFGLIIAAQVTGRLASKVGEKRLFTCGLGLALSGGMLLLIVSIVGGGLAAVSVALFLAVSSVGVVNTAGVSIAMQSQGENAGSASALLGLLQFMFGALVAPLVGLGGSHTALPMGIVIASCHIGAIIIYMVMVYRTQKVTLSRDVSI